MDGRVKFLALGLDGHMDMHAKMKQFDWIVFLPRHGTPEAFPEGPAGGFRSLFTPMIQLRKSFSRYAQEA